MASWGERKKAWSSRWQQLRREYLQGRLIDALVYECEAGKYRWECPVCGESGTAVTSEKLATTAGRGHAQRHISSEDFETLEDLKVLHMPADLLTAYQRRRREALVAEGAKTNPPQLPPPRDQDAR